MLYNIKDSFRFARASKICLFLFFLVISTYMFAGIIESTNKITEVFPLNQALRIQIERPTFFDDLKVGDSISVNGVCLTLESCDRNHMMFTLGYESLKVLGWNKENLVNKQVNLERSLKFGDRIHGHLVSGHVDSLAKVLEKSQLGESLFYRFSLPQEIKRFIWKKGSIAIQGVSLTVNEIDESSFTVCLIPETLKKTNLALLVVNELINVESDYLIKGLTQSSSESRTI